MILVEVPVLANDTDDTVVFALIDLDGDIAFVLQGFDDPLWFAAVRKSEHFHEVLVRGHAAESIVERKNLAPHQLLVPRKLPVAPDILGNVCAFEITFIGRNAVTLHSGNYTSDLVLASKSLSPSSPDCRPIRSGVSIPIDWLSVF